MKIRYKILNFILALTICLSSLIGLASTLRASQTGFVFADAEFEFANSIYHPTAICSDENYVYVFDAHLSQIKVYNKTTNALRETAPTLNFNRQIIKMQVVQNLLFVLTNTPTRISVFDAQTLTLIASQSSTAQPFINGSNNIAVFPFDATTICLALTTPEPNGDTINILNLVQNEGVWSFSDDLLAIKREYGFSLPAGSKIASINALKATEENNIHIIYSTDQNQAFVLTTNLSQKSPFPAPTQLAIGLADANILDVLRINVNSQNLLAVITDKTSGNLKLFSENITSGYAISALPAKTITHTDNLIFTNNDNQIYACDGANQKVYSFEFNAEGNLSEGVFLENSELSITDLEPQNFVYYKTTKNTGFYASPYSTTSEFELPQNAHLCKFQSVKINEVDLENFVPCLYTTTENNFFGYVKVSDIEVLPPSTFNKTTVRIGANTKLFKLPSVITSPSVLNEELATLDEVTELEVVSPTNSACNTYTAGGKNFILVKTADEKVGFIDATRIITITTPQQMVPCNATVKRQTKVYADANCTTEIDTLNVGQRVQIADGQKTNSKYVKITYNNADGAEVTGFIQTDALTRDSWSILQIIGLVFIVLNVVFLLILLFVKKRINHD